jgi:hypothetical protein
MMTEEEEEEEEDRVTLTSFPLPFLDLPLMSAAIVLFVTIKHST